jgi:ADP-heptose:LPS heptosyltransferase
VKVLIFKVNKLGDNVVFVPVIQAIRRYRPDWRILFFTNSLAEPLYGPPGANEKFVIQDRGPFLQAWQQPSQLMSLLKIVRDFKPDRCLFASDQGNTAYFLGLLSGAQTRVGRKREFHRVPGAITRPQPFDPSGSEALDGWKLLLRLAENTDGPKLPDLPPVPNLDHLKTSASEAPDTIVIYAGASAEFQRWPLNSFVELANRLSRDFQVCWIKESRSGASGLDPGVQLIDTPALSDLITVLAGVRLFIGNNSGPFQLASALGTPSIIINGPSSRRWDPFWFPERFRMLRDESVPCLPCEAYYSECQNPHRMQCMEKWTADAVEAEARTWLNAMDSLLPKPKHES